MKGKERKGRRTKVNTGERRRLPSAYVAKKASVDEGEGRQREAILAIQHPCLLYYIITVLCVSVRGTESKRVLNSTLLW